MPGSRAQRPGRHCHRMSGKTIEVLNTDAEGRLILADALTYARRQGCTHLVDAATLTGAIVVALGHLNVGLFSNNDGMRDRVMAAAKAEGERCGPMPLDDDYKEYLKSAFADLANIGGRWGGAITAAMFLKEFAEDTPWVHLDIAGTAWLDDAKPYLAKGPTGVPVRTLVRLARTGRTGSRTDKRVAGLKSPAILHSRPVAVCSSGVCSPEATAVSPSASAVASGSTRAIQGIRVGFGIFSTPQLALSPACSFVTLLLHAGNFFLAFLKPMCANGSPYKPPWDGREPWLGRAARIRRKKLPARFPTLARTTTTTAAAATPAAARGTAESTAAAAALRLRPGFVDIQRPTVQIIAIQGFNRPIGLRGIGHFDEREAPGATGLTVSHQIYTIHVAVGLKQRTDGTFGGPEIQITYKNVFHILRSVFQSCGLDEADWIRPGGCRTFKRHLSV